MSYRSAGTILLLSILLSCLACLALDEAGVIDELNRASRCMTQQKWAEAHAAFKEVLKAQPDNPYALAGAARILMRGQKFDEAIKLLEKAQSKLPSQEDSTLINEWQIIGPFPNPHEGKGLEIPYPPEKEISLDAAYDGKPGDPAACKAAWAKMTQSCAECHNLCRGKGMDFGKKAMPCVKMVYPKNKEEMTKFADSLSDIKSIMMILQTACKPGTTNANEGAVGAAAYFADIMKTVQARANKLFAKNQTFVTAGKTFCGLCDAVIAARDKPTKVKWQKMNGQQVRELDKSLGPFGNAVFYGLATIPSDKNQVVELRVGSDDGCKVWLNGKPIWTHPVRRGVNPDNDHIFVRLAKGNNTLLMKIEQGLGNYGMAAKIVRAMSVAGLLQRARQQWNKIKNMARVRMSAKGLRKDSQRQYWIYKKARCCKRPPAGKVEILPPGEYTIRVGFPSGYIAKDFNLKAGEEFTIPTGLFTFKQVTPENLVSTVPQKLYNLETEKYLVTGYQGQTARLYPGKYRVCYQDMNEEQPSLAFGPWHVVGPFPNPSKKPKYHLGYDIEYPPEKEPIPDLKKSYESMGQKIGWKKIEDYPEINIVKAIPGWGIAYATATVHSDADREVELVLTLKGGAKVWLNGEMVKAVRPGRRAYYPLRLHKFVRLNKGPNCLFVKLPRAAGDWPLSAVAIKWKMYDVDIVADNK
ncbi:MAG: tetratricopeptide repeat protein [Planctomycetes bacterium]|nr:tetratricopeptide repeat protein [Planctomycetota bacterium]